MDKGRDTPAQTPAAAARDVDAVAREIRLRLGASLVLLAAVMALPVITSFTSLLNGFVGGVGSGWVAGFGEFVIGLGGAIAYCRWADRHEAREEGESRMTHAADLQPRPDAEGRRSA